MNYKNILIPTICAAIMAGIGTFIDYYITKSLHWRVALIASIGTLLVTLLQELSIYFKPKITNIKLSNKLFLGQNNNI